MRWSPARKYPESCPSLKWLRLGERRPSSETNREQSSKPALVNEVLNLELAFSTRIQNAPARLHLGDDFLNLFTTGPPGRHEFRRFFAVKGYGKALAALHAVKKLREFRLCF